MKALEEIKKRCEAATPGPWRRNSCNPRSIVSPMSHPICDTSEPFHRQTERGTGDDEEFIAHARTDVPRLVKALEVAIECLTEHSIVSYRMEAKEEIDGILNGEGE